MGLIMKPKDNYENSIILLMSLHNWATIHENYRKDIREILKRYCREKGYIYSELSKKEVLKNPQPGYPKNCNDPMICFQIDDSAKPVITN